MTGDPFHYFRLEAHELIEALDSGVVDLERAGDPELTARLLRQAHTLKGAARVVNQHEIADEAHALEDLLVPHRSATTPLPTEVAGPLLGGLDRIRARLTALPPRAAEPPEQPTAAEGADPLADDGWRSGWTDGSDLDELIEGIGETAAQLAVVKRHTAAPAGTATAKHRLTEAIEHAERELRHLHELAERMRLVPAKAIFGSLGRAVRDVAVAQRKDVSFEARGGETAVSPPVLRDVLHGLLHVVRNAVAHGIEAPAARAGAGKPPRGTVTVEVSRRGRRIAFRCQDDGRGVDLAAVRAAVASAGAHPEPERLDTDAVLGYLFDAGISTAETVTEVAGRGVGLDVLRAAARRLGGEIGIRTDPGRGTTVDLLVPVSLASLDVLVVRCAAQTVAVPLDAVRAGIRVTRSMIVGSGAGIVDDDGALVPYLHLDRLLPGSAETGGPARPGPALLVRTPAATVAVGVDRLVGPAAVVVRPLPATAGGVAVVVGAWIDTEGTPCLVLEPESLVEQVVAAADRSGAPPPAPTRPTAPILVVDDSVTSRMLERGILESAGYTVDLATNGAEALEKARRTRYGLFLVDVEMPLMDGFTFVEHARADPGLRHIPVIMLTSRGSAEDRARGRRAGVDAHLDKNEFDQRELLDNIRNLVG